MGIALLVIIVFVLMFFNEYEKATDMLDLCHSKGYDGYKDMSGFGLSKYKCYKKVPVETGYEYEYSGYID